jgi:hypothetical protein
VVLLCITGLCKAHIVELPNLLFMRGIEAQKFCFSRFIVFIGYASRRWWFKESRLAFEDPAGKYFSKHIDFERSV